MCTITALQKRFISFILLICMLSSIFITATFGASDTYKSIFVKILSMPKAQRTILSSVILHFTAADVENFITYIKGDDLTFSEGDVESLRSFLNTYISMPLDNKQKIANLIKGTSLESDLTDKRTADYYDIARKINLSITKDVNNYKGIQSLIGILEYYADKANTKIVFDGIGENSSKIHFSTLSGKNGTEIKTKAIDVLFKISGALSANGVNNFDELLSKIEGTVNSYPDIEIAAFKNMLKCKGLYSSNYSGFSSVDASSINTITATGEGIATYAFNIDRSKLPDSVKDFKKISVQKADDILPGTIISQLDDIRVLGSGIEPYNDEKAFSYTTDKTSNYIVVYFFGAGDRPLGYGVVSNTP